MTSPSLRQLVVAALLLGTLGMLTHGRVIENDYAFDAFYTVRDNAQIRVEASLVEIFSSPYWDAELFPGRGLYRPLSVWTFQQTRRIWDAPVAVDHAIDLGLHVLCGLALLTFLMQMGARFGAALTLAALFLLHPVQTEVVASLVGRCDLLATLFALWALNWALASRISGAGRWIGSWVLFSLSLFAKESAVTLCVLLPACWAARELWRDTSMADVWRGALPLVFSLGFALACHLALRQAVLGDLVVHEFAMHGDAEMDFFELRWRALAFTSLYAQKIFWPHPLLPDYLTGVISAGGHALHLRAVAALVLILASAAWPAWSWLRRRRLTRAHLGILLFWIAVAPVSNLLIQIGTPFGERLIYFPLVFLLLVAIDLPLWQSVKVGDLGLGPRLWPIWAALALLFGLLSATRIGEWKDNHSLFQAAVRDCPENYYSQMSFGTTLMREGGGLRERELTLSAFKAAAQVRPLAYPPWAMLGQLAYAEGDLPTARSHFEQADRLAIGPEREPSLLNLSRTYHALEEFGRVESLLVPAAREHPDWIEIQRELANYWLTRGQIADALAQFERVLQIKPRDKTVWRAIIRAHLKLGQDEQALRRLRTAPPGTLDYKFRIQLEQDGLTLPNRSAG